MPTDLNRFLFLFAALYIAFGVLSPFFPAFLSSRGVSAEEIGLVLSAGGIVRLISGPIAGRIADRRHALKTVFSLCALTAGVFALAYVPAYGVAPLLVVSLLQAATLAPTTTLADALAVRNARSSGNANGRFEYGWVRGTGSTAFILGSLISGQVLDAFPPSSALVAQAIFLALAAAAAIFVPEIAGRQQTAVPARSAATDFASLAFNRPFRWLVAVAAIVLGSHAMHDSFAMIAWNAAGISPGIGSVIWSESVAAEVLVFLFLGPWLLNKIGPVPAMAISAAAAVLRWSVLAQSSSVLGPALVEPLHGLTFALLHLACMRILVLVTPASLAATAQAIYALGIGAASVLLTFASGFLYARFGAGGFFSMAALAAASFPAIWALSRSLGRFGPATRTRKQ